MTSRFDDVFESRGIDEAPREARGYGFWTDSDRDPVKEAYRGLKGHQKSRLVYYAGAPRPEGSPSGIIITRWAFPEFSDDPIFPEIRPDFPVITRRTRHYHGPDPDTIKESDPKLYEEIKALPARYVLPPKEESRATLKHIKRAKDKLPEEYSDEEMDAGDHTRQIGEDENGNPIYEYGFNFPDRVHEHRHIAKYIFPSGGRVEKPFEHDHSENYPFSKDGTRTKKRQQKLNTHLRRYHDGEDVVGKHYHGKYEHTHAASYPGVQSKLAAHITEQHVEIRYTGGKTTRIARDRTKGKSHTHKSYTHDHEREWPRAPKSGKRSKAREAAYRLHILFEHGGVEVEGEHTHPAIFHSHEDYTPEERMLYQHCLDWHAGVISQNHLRIHSHVHTVKNTESSLAARIDVNPMALDMWEKAEVVFFGIEGCLKADSMLSAIIREKLKATVMSVPAVSLWLTKELKNKEFIKKYLSGKIVVVVPDADWRTKPQVKTQALLCRSYLERHGIRALVAAPDGEALKKYGNGVDDYLGKGGGKLGDLVVVEKNPPPEFVEFMRTADKKILRDSPLGHYVMRPGDRITKTVRAVDVLSALIAHSAPDGSLIREEENPETGEVEVVGASYDIIAKLLRVPKIRKKKGKEVSESSKMRVSRAVKDLIAYGAIDVDGDGDTASEKLAAKMDYFKRSLDWASEEAPIIMIHPDLTTEDSEEVKLSVKLEQAKREGLPLGWLFLQTPIERHKNTTSYVTREGDSKSISARDSVKTAS